MLWPLHLETDAAERRRAAEALGAALLAPFEGMRLDRLELDIGDVSADDVAALQRGAEGSSSPVDAVRAPRFQVVKWKAPHTSEASIERVAKLLGNVGVCELEIDVGDRDLACRVLKNVLQDCAATLTGINWWGLECTDADKLEDPTPWANFRSQLRGLRVFVRDGGDPIAARALDALLARVGSNLDNLVVGSFQGALPDRVAEIILARCPRLVTLHVSNASQQFYQYLTNAYRIGRCRTSTLSLQAIPRAIETGLPTLLEALQVTTHGVTRTLRTLTLSTVWKDGPASDEVFDALTAALSTNSSLTRVVLGGRFGPEAKMQLQALPHQFAIHVPSRRRRLALISVCSERQRLPPDVLQVVFSFAGRRTSRYEFQ